MSYDNEHKVDQFIGQKIFNKYKVLKRLGRGSFGYIYLVEYNNKLYAMKSENEKKDYLLEKEVYLMSYLYGPRIPYVKSFGQFGNYNILVMELLGKSLEDIMETLPSKKISVSSVCKLSYQMLQILEHLHNKGFLHRDIKPDNFIMGIGPNSKFLYICDFGFCKMYRNPNTLAHLPMQKTGGITGTPRFASINALKELTQSRRDDLESLGYVLIYIAKGTLPWADIKSDDKRGLYNRILEVKMETTPEELCQGLPIQFEEYIKYVKGLSYEQEPDYKYLKNLFLMALKNIGGKMDYCYDWDSRINNINILPENETYNGNNAVIENCNFEPNIEKIFNDDNALKANFNNQIKMDLQKNIYSQNEINDSAIEPFTLNDNELKNLKHDALIFNRRLKSGNNECCTIM